MAGAAGIENNYRKIPEVGPVTHGWLDAHFGCDTYNDEGVDSSVSQGQVEPCSFKGRHRQLIKNAFVAARRYLGRDLKPGIVSKKRRLHLFRRVDVLPSHRDAELEYPHQFCRQRKMAGKEYAYPSITGDGQHLQNLSRHSISILDLTQNADLHVVNQQGYPFWIAHFVQRLGDVKSKNVFHARINPEEAKLATRWQNAVSFAKQVGNSAGGFELPAQPLADEAAIIAFPGIA